MIRDTSATDRQLAKPKVSRPWRRWLSTAVVVLGLLIGVGYLVRGWLRASSSIERSRLRIAQVERGALVRDVVADGRVVAANSPTLYAIAGGSVEFHVRAGDKVVRGQVLATLSSPELQAKLAQEQATLAGLEAGVGRAGLDIQHGRANEQQAIAQAEVDRQTAAREVEINQQMYGRGVISELELRRSEDLLKKADIVLSHAKIDAGLSGKELTFDLGTKTQDLGRQRSVVQELERQVAALELASPVDGQVGQLLVAERTVVTANAPILTVVDLGAFELEIQVPDAFARDLALGMAAEIRSGNATFPGRVRSISPEVVAGTVATRLEFSDPPGMPGRGQRPAGLRQNQRLTARILIEERPNVLEVERGSFIEGGASGGGGNFAYFVEDGVAEKRPIRIGSVSLDKVELLSGAKVGDQIVVSGADTFGTAERVRLAN
ncbi:MAG: HlyD family efflux transporter periplasmic adaptor subunit [Kofleriaceae bacterium]